MWIERRSGKNHKRSEQDHRDPFERDRTRVIHSPAFRRLQRKTQILGTDEGDFHRTRLTHSLEVASISSSIVKSLHIRYPDHTNLIPSQDLISSVSLLHDIGHPPFGHGGEVALNYMMRHNGGFEGNAQTLRLLTKLEQSYGQYGLDLTRRTLLGLLKYPTVHSQTLMLSMPKARNTLTNQIKVNDWKPPKCYFDCENNEVEWILYPLTDNDKQLFTSMGKLPCDNQHGKSQYKSFDCSIMDLADDIAYGVHDLEDAIHLKLVIREQIDNDEFRQLLLDAGFCAKSHIPTFIGQLFSSDIYQKKLAIGEMVNYFITEAAIVTVNADFEEELIRFNVTLPEKIANLLNYLQHCIYHYVIDSQEARTFEYGGQTVILRLFEAFSSNPESLLDDKNRKKFLEASTTEQPRIICDTIANMTDEYAYRMHERLLGFNTRTIFERL